MSESEIKFSLFSACQTNSINCGIFAAAYAAEIVARNIRGIQGPFDVGAMRHHLEQSLEQQSLTLFPKVSHGQFGGRRNVIIVDVSEQGCEDVM